VNKHVRDIEIHLAYNDTLPNIQDYGFPATWILHTYPDNIVWTAKVNKVLKELASEYVLFIHEDWLPTDSVSGTVLEELTQAMRRYAFDYLLSYAHVSVTSAQAGIPTGYPDYFFYREGAHIFQPAIWKRAIFEEFTSVLQKSKAENEDQDCLALMSRKRCYSVQNVATVTSLRTTNSLLFPHMHALSRGEWNFRKYPTLKALLDSYGINTNDRGINNWWELETQ
jgi:hypothetical protein